MAHVQSNLFNAISGSVGNVTVASYRGKTIARGKIFTRKETHSPELQHARACFRAVTQLAPVYRQAIQAGRPWATWAEARNAFIGSNLKNPPFKEEAGQLVLQPEQLLCVQGELVPPALTAEWHPGEGTLTARWERQALSPVARDEDDIYIVAVDLACKRSKSFHIGRRGEPGEVAVLLPGEPWDVPSVLFYAFAVSPERRKCSNSVFVLPERFE